MALNTSQVSSHTGFSIIDLYCENQQILKLLHCFDVSEMCLGQCVLPALGLSLQFYSTETKDKF